MSRKSSTRKSSKARQKKKLSLKNFVILALLAVVLIALGQSGDTLADESGQQSSPSPSGSAQATAAPQESEAPSGASGASDPYSEAELAIIAAAASNAELSRTAEGQSATFAEVSAKLAKLPVKGRAPKTGYSRDEFGQAWADADWNDCDTRNDILRRDLNDPRTDAGSDGCKVLYGTLEDRFTGNTIDFVRGDQTSAQVQIDHIVALSDAWQKGAQALTPRARLNLSNDPLNLIAADGPTNSSKSDKDAASWLPPNREFRCDFAAAQVDVKTKYALWVTKAEREALARVLDSCTGEVTPIAQVPHTRDSVRATSAGYREAQATAALASDKTATKAATKTEDAKPSTNSTAGESKKPAGSSASDKGVSPLSKTDCPAKAPIKGNQGSNGWKYHVPGGRWYSNTHPEQCFKTEDGAAKAGYEYAQNQ